MKETRAEKNYVSETYFRMWVRAMYDQFMESNAVVQYYKNYTYVYLRSKVGTAKCNSNDTFENRIGIAYAWARCTGQPEYYKKKKKYTPKVDEWVYIKTKNSKIRILVKYITEGIDNYCFKEGCGKLVLINKNEIISISPSDY